MAKKVCVILANGFEEIEGLTVVDLLRRADINVVTASISDSLEIKGSHKIHVMADDYFKDINLNELDMLVLPGGGVGTENLAACDAVDAALKTMVQTGKEIAAICAAPSVPGDLGLLKGKKAACYPGFEPQLRGAEVVYDEVAVDKQVITSRGLGTAIPFALALIERLENKELAEEIAKAIIYKAN